MSFRISSSVYPTASLAAIFAIGKPVALEARAELRETRGFISMTTRRPVSGWTANWMLEPPVSTPIARVHAHRVEVLDRADDDDVVLGVAHHLELELLPAGDRLLDEDLVGGRRLQPPGDLRTELCL